MHVNLINCLKLNETFYGSGQDLQHSTVSEVAADCCKPVSPSTESFSKW